MKKFLVILVVVLLGGGGALVATGYDVDDVGDLFEDEQSPASEEEQPYRPSSSVSGDWYTVYFVPGDTVEEHLIDLVNGAAESVLAAIQEINLEAVSTAFIEADDRGVDVKIIIEEDYSDPSKEKAFAQYSRLNNMGLVKTDHRSALMHNKFVVIDGKTVWTGSTNMTEYGVNGNNNNVIVIDSQELALNFTTEFNEMWEGEFGVTSPSDTPYPELDLDGTIVETYFAPEDDVEEQIIQELKQAQESIYFAAFTFTSDPIEAELLAKTEEGLEIKGILEKRQGANSSAYALLEDAGIPVLWDGNSRTMHHKIFILDSETVITGSFNFTSNANKSNDENILIVHNPDIANAFYKEFSSMWDEWDEG